MLRSLQEVVKVWKKVSSQASFSLDVKDGAATLQLSFQLSSPEDVHSEHADQPGTDLPNDHCHVHRETHPSWRRHKGPARQQKDRARAAAYRASRLQAADTAAITTTTAAVASAVPVKLPFTGNILPLQRITSGCTPAVLPPASSASTFISVTSPPPSSYAAAVSAIPPPIKKVGTGLNPVNTSLAKKKLFQPQPDQHQPQAPHLAQAHGQKSVQSRSSFKKTEDELFKKLFPS